MKKKFAKLSQMFRNQLGIATLAGVVTLVLLIPINGEKFNLFNLS